jgi:hypothetical protein
MMYLDQIRFWQVPINGDYGNFGMSISTKREGCGIKRWACIDVGWTVQMFPMTTIKVR